MFPSTEPTIEARATSTRPSRSVRITMISSGEVAERRVQQGRDLRAGGLARLGGGVAQHVGQAGDGDARDHEDHGRIDLGQAQREGREGGGRDRREGDCSRRVKPARGWTALAATVETYPDRRAHPRHQRRRHRVAGAARAGRGAGAAGERHRRRPGHQQTACLALDHAARGGAGGRGRPARRQRRVRRRGDADRLRALRHARPGRRRRPSWSSRGSTWAPTSATTSATRAPSRRPSRASSRGSRRSPSPSARCPAHGSGTPRAARSTTAPSPPSPPAWWTRHPAGAAAGHAAERQRARPAAGPAERRPGDAPRPAHLPHARSSSYPARAAGASTACTTTTRPTTARTAPTSPRSPTAASR